MAEWKKKNFIVGHFGSGKTEFSIHLALELRKIHEDVAAVDLDIINVYFRLREQEALLKKKGIQLYSSSVRNDTLDIPALDAGIYAPLENPNTWAVVDVGGNPSGARALGRYAPYFQEGSYDTFLVINANRPETETAEQVIRFLEGIEMKGRIRVTQLVNTTNMLKETSVEDLLRGYELVQRVSEETGIPIWGSACLSHLVPALQKKGMPGRILPMNLLFRSDWMS